MTNSHTIKANQTQETQNYLQKLETTCLLLTDELAQLKDEPELLEHEFKQILKSGTLQDKSDFLYELWSLFELLQYRTVCACRLTEQMTNLVFEAKKTFKCDRKETKK